VCDDSIFPLSEVHFDTSNDVPHYDWVGSYTSAYENYEGAFNELSAGRPQEHCKAYVQAVRDATMASQMPYYQLMCPELFGECVK
jgi:N-acetylmuramoyl-L-alanine amidase CwlA